jgi:hypothetical protein
VPQLSGAAMKQRIKIEDEERAAAEAKAKIRPGESTEAAALRIQKVRRGSQARRKTAARVMRHLVVQTPVGFFVSSSEIEKWFT